MEEIDRAIAVAVLDETGDVNDVARVMSQCDRFRGWRREMSQGEFQERAREYVGGLCEEALQNVKKREIEIIKDLVL
jgi:hypothetical protein